MDDFEGEDNYYSVKADINLIPMMDLVFNLLIIFMITAPMIQRGIDVDLPTSKSNTMKAEERIMITIDAGKNIYVNDEKTHPEQLVAILETIKIKNRDITVYLKSDRNVPYGSVIQVMDAIKQVGIERVGMVTEQLETLRK